MILRVNKSGMSHTEDIELLDKSRNGPNGKNAIVQTISHGGDFFCITPRYPYAKQTRERPICARRGGIAEAVLSQEGVLLGEGGKWAANSE